MGIFDRDHWNEVAQTIARNRRRSFFTSMGVFWGVFMLTVMLGAGGGIANGFRQWLGGLAVNSLLMSPDQTELSYRGMPANRTWRIYNEDIDAIRRLPSVERVSGCVWGNSSPCVRGNRKGDYQMMGFSPDYQSIVPARIVEGRFLNQLDIDNKRKVCVIGIQIRNELFPELTSVTGEVLNVNGNFLTIVGVAEKQSDFVTLNDTGRSVILPISLLQQLYNYDNRVHMLAVTGRASYSIDQVEEQVRESLYKRHRISPDDKKALWVISMSKITGKIFGLFDGIDLLTWIVGLGTLLAGIVGVSNIMLVLVKERTQEIGIRRAIGAPPSAIILQILTESFTLTSVAGLLGLAMAVGLLSLADMILESTLGMQSVAVPSCQISFWTGITALAIVVCGSVLGGILPAVRALSIKAVDAIREE